MDITKDITDHQSFFACVRQINEKYLKPADINVRIIEGYVDNSAIIGVFKLKDMYGHLLQAIEPVDMASGKKKIEEALEKYVNELQKFLVNTQLFLITVRKEDLKKNIHADKAAQLENEIAPRKKIFDEINEKAKKAKDKGEDATKYLDALITCATTMQTIVEKYYKANNLD